MNMKRISFIVLALALLVAFTQCKKEQNAQTNETVAITLDIRNGGTRMDVNTVTGEVTYEEGDVIYVVSGGKYVGTLTHNGTNFSGPITNPTVGEPLHFYFLGNVTPAETLTAGTTESCSVVISDQTEHLPVIEYAPSDENYTAGSTAFTAFLLNKCALVKFNVTTLSEAATCVTGFNNKVTVDFTDASFAYSQTNNGNIILPAGSGEKWAILLPQEAMEAGEAGSAYSQDGTYTGTCGAVPAIYDNGFVTAGIAVNVTTEVNPGEVPVGAISGKFTINANGDQVYFSQGNLQYQASTDTWRFAMSQWDYVGAANSNISQTYSGWIDLFGWGTSGYHNPNDVLNINYEPWSTAVATLNTTYNYYGYGPSTNMGSMDLTGSSANYDWGVYNAISNGGNQVNSSWRTLTGAEWGYIINTRSTTWGIRYAKATINGINGIILLPDDWSPADYMLYSTDIVDVSYSVNTISADDWLNVLEPHGAVFLPAACQRDSNSSNPGCANYINPYLINYRGYYWSSTHDYYGGSNSQKSRCLMFYETSSSNLVGVSSCSRYKGCSVRLVRDVE